MVENDRATAQRWEDLAKVGVEGSNPFARSRFYQNNQPLIADGEAGCAAVQRNGMWSLRAATNPMVRSMRRLSKGGAWDETLATTIWFARSTNTFWP
jgi:hypothetical protein